MYKPNYLSKIKLTFILSLLIIVVILAQSSLTIASTDLSLSATGLSYPLGTSFKANAGYAKIFYDQTQTKNGGLSKLIRGYIRPNLIFKTSFVINTLGYGINISPFLPIEFSYSKEYQRRKYNNFTAFDCLKVTCSVYLIERESYDIKIALAYQKFFLIQTAHWQNIILDHSKNNYFAEENSLLLGQGTDDQLFQNILLIGYKTNDKDFLGIISLYSKMKKTSQNASLTLITLGKSFKNLFLMAGIGTLNRLGKTNLTALFNLKWTIKKGLFPFH